MSGSLVLLDANVVYPMAVCDFILTAAGHQLLARPVVTRNILDEARRNLLIDRPDLALARIERRFNALRAATDGHDRPVRSRFPASEMINFKDRHVVAAAVQHGVDYIVTNDARLCKEVGIWLTRGATATRLCTALTPDELVGALIAESERSVVEVIRAMAARLRSPMRTAREVAAALSRALPSVAGLDIPG